MGTSFWVTDLDWNGAGTSTFAVAVMNADILPADVTISGPAGSTGLGEVILPPLGHYVFTPSNTRISGPSLGTTGIFHVTSDALVRVVQYNGYDAAMFSNDASSNLPDSALATAGQSYHVFPWANPGAGAPPVAAFVTLYASELSTFTVSSPVALTAPPLPPATYNTVTGVYTLVPGQELTLETAVFGADPSGATISVLSGHVGAFSGNSGVSVQTSCGACTTLDAISDQLVPEPATGATEFPICDPVYAPAPNRIVRVTSSAAGTLTVDPPGNAVAAPATLAGGNAVATFEITGDVVLTTSVPAEAALYLPSASLPPGGSPGDPAWAQLVPSQNQGYSSMAFLQDPRDVHGAGFQNYVSIAATGPVLMAMGILPVSPLAVQKAPTLGLSGPGPLGDASVALVLPPGAPVGSASAEVGTPLLPLGNDAVSPPTQIGSSPYYCSTWDAEAGGLLLVSNHHVSAEFYGINSWASYLYTSGPCTNPTTPSPSPTSGATQVALGCSVRPYEECSVETGPDGTTVVLGGLVSIRPSPLPGQPGPSASLTPAICSTFN